MKDRLLFIIGAIFVFASGLIYTIERAAANIAGNLELAGFHAGGRTGEVPASELPGFSDNVYVPVFLVVGLALIAFASLKGK